MSGQPFLDFANKHLNVVQMSGDEAMVRCVVHDDSKASMQFNVRKGMWVCFACHAGGGIKRLCRELGITEYSEPEPDLDDIYAKLKELSMEPQRGVPKAKPESLLKRYDLPTDYWLNRGFKEETIKAFDLGLDMWDDAVTIPLRDDAGRLLGVIKRYLEEDVDLRYKYPKGFKRSMNLFASWLVEAHASDHVVLVEGSVDAMKVWQAGIPALAIYGSSISPAQVRLLRRLGVGQVTLFFDNDKAGREAADCCLGIKHHTKKGKKSGERVHYTEYDPRTDLRRGFLVSRVAYPASYPGDPGAMSNKQIKRCVNGASLLNAG